MLSTVGTARVIISLWMGVRVILLYWEDTADDSFIAGIISYLNGIFVKRDGSF